MSPKMLFSTTELAKILNVTRATICNKIKAGTIKAIKVGKSFAIPIEEAEKLIGNIYGKPLTNEKKEEISKIVDRIVDEYGEALRLLGEE